MMHEPARGLTTTLGTQAQPWVSLRSRLRELASGVLPPRGGRLSLRYQRLRARLWLLPLLAVMWGVYAFFMSAGGLTHWPILGTYYDLMADGFRMGQLHMPIEPHPALLRAKNPYDMVNIRYWALDASYYAGKYYGYWGPVPALLQAAGKSLLGIRRTIGDHPVSLFHLCLGSWFGALLIDRMGRQLFGRISRTLIVLGSLAFAFANPTLHGATTAGTYLAAILAGQAWLVVGLVPAFDAVFLAEAGATKRYSLIAAGGAFGLALASRVTLLPGIALLVAITAFTEAWGFERRLRRTFLNALWIGAPIAAVGVALLVYNKVRFDDWFEFGSKIQLSAFPTFRIASEYLLPNLYSYVLRPWVPSCQFPYLFQVWRMGPSAFPSGFSLPQDYLILEPVIGWLYAVPLSWLIPCAIFLAPRPLNLDTRERRTYLFCLGSFVTLASLTGLVAMGLYTATMRYSSDIVSGLVLLSLLGAFALKTHRLGRLAPRTISSVIALLALSTVVLGMLIGYQGYNGHFHRHNRKLDGALVDALSVCRDAKPDVPRFWP